MHFLKQIKIVLPILHHVMKAVVERILARTTVSITSVRLKSVLIFIFTLYIPHGEISK